MSPKARHFEHEGERWRAVRTGASSGTSPGGYFPKAKPPGLLFIPQDGNQGNRFLPMNDPPSQHKLEEMGEVELADLLARAKPTP